MEDEYREETIDLRDYLRVLRKRRWVIISIFIVMVLAVAVHTFTATPIYEASSRIVIEKENPNLVSIQEVMAVDSTGTDYYQTQYKIIESRVVVRASSSDSIWPTAPSFCHRLKTQCWPRSKGGSTTC